MTAEPSTHRIEKLFSMAFLTVVVLVVTALAGEGLARFALVNVASEAQFLNYASQQQPEARFGTDNVAFSPHLYLSLAPTPGFERGQNRHNELGFRGDEIDLPKPPGEFRIVALGGSTTYTSMVDDYRMAYPAQLEAALREKGYSVRVVNGGTPDWTTLETLTSFATLELDPDLVIVHHAINDLAMRMVWPPEKYRGDHSGSRQSALSHVRMVSLLEHSTLARYFLIRFGATLPHARVGRMFRRAKSSMSRQFQQQKRDGTYPSGTFVSHPWEDIMAANPPRYFRRNLRSLAAIATANKIQVVYPTMAVAPDRLELLFGTREEAVGIGTMNGVTREVARAVDAPLLDFATADLEDGWFVDGVHLNEAGATFKGGWFARELVDRGLLPALTENDGAAPLSDRGE